MKNYKSDKPCIVCCESRDNFVTYHHVYSQKSFPEFKDECWNLLSLCQLCHIECHMMGNKSFMKKYVKVARWMEENGWIVFNGKLLNKNAVGEV